MRGRLRRWLGLAILLSMAVGLLVLVRLDRRVQAYLAGPALGSTRIYAAPEVLLPGARLSAASLERQLARLGYRPAAGTDLGPGEFRVGADGVELAQRPSPVPWADPPRRAQVALREGRVVELRALDGAPLERLQLEPEMLAVVGGGGPVLEAGAEAVPDACRAAVLAAEDRHFFRHPGVDPGAVARALIADLRARERRQGGSTITQQLVKNAFLSPHRTLMRKVREAVLALLLEVHASKEEILRRYLASVYLGTDGGVPVHGFAQGAEVYFGKPVGDLDPAECALLAGMIRSPNALAPRRHPHAAVVRRNRVLALMAKGGLFDRAQVRAAMAEPLRLAPAPVRPVAALYVADEVRRDLARLLPAEAAHAPGLSVFTAIDADAQREAERAVRRGLAGLDRAGARRARKGQRLQAALVALDPRTGRVRALVGGRDYGSSPLDRAIRTRRQPGSAFKPFLYLAALDPGRRGKGRPWTVVSRVDDSPVVVPVGNKVWRPANYDGIYRGPVALEDAFAQSLNAATVRIAREVGIDAVARAAADLGITSPLPRVPALALGVAETSLLELTAAYAVFASGGVHRPPALVEAVSSADGELLYTTPGREERVLDPAVAYLVTHLLERVVDAGTARAARGAGLTGAVAGKTGTTDDTRDAWFVGFNPEVVAGVWVGFDDGAPTGFTGAAAALPIWIDFVRTTTGPDLDDRFTVPAGIVWRDVDPASGLLASSACPEVRREPFLAGSEPETACDLHRPLWATVGGELGGAVRGTGRALELGGRRLRDWFGRIFR